MIKKSISYVKKYWWFSLIIGFLFWLVYVLWNCNLWLNSDCTGFKGKTIWDVLELIFIPITITVVVAFLDKLNRKTDRENADKRAVIDQKIAQDNQSEVALQNFFDSMTNLLLDYDLRSSIPEDEVCKIAQAKTSSTLEVLDLGRKSKLIRFLGEIGIFCNSQNNTTIISLSGMNLNYIDLRHAALQCANLKWAFLEETELGFCHLENANLEGAHLKRASFNGAYLNRANLFSSELSEANFCGADLSKANLSFAQIDGASLLRANLEETDLSYALLKNTNLEGANFKNANLCRANLTGANINKANLEGARMPDNKIFDPNIHYEKYSNQNL